MNPKLFPPSLEHNIQGEKNVRSCVSFGLHPEELFLQLSIFVKKIIIFKLKILEASSIVRITKHPISLRMKKKSLVVIDNILKTLVFFISFLNCLSLQKAYSSFTVNMKNKKGKMCPNGFQLDNRHRSIRKASFFF